MRRPRAQSWMRTLGVGRGGAFVLDTVFGPEYLVVAATEQHDRRQGIDRFLIHRQDGTVIYRVDYKCDERAGETANLALEHVSVERAGRRESPGWVHTTVSDLVVSYVPARATAFVMEVAALRTAWPDILAAFPPKRASTAGRRPYESVLCCVPIRWLSDAGLIVKTVDAVGRQLRFTWPA